jgi:hypothetical protein
MTISTRATIIHILGVLVFAGAAPLVHAQAGVGAKYGTRDPRTCMPDKSSIVTVSSASKLFTCFVEKETGEYLYLVTDLKLEVGAARKYQTSDSYPELDQNAPIYPIRGSFTRYQCSRQFNIDASHTNVGTNCNAYPQPEAQGICYRTTFGDWSCRMFDRVTSSAAARMRVAPPKQ